ncbi:MAG: ABC transporter permease subunit [Streptosporangiales bacterium]|nr:ABC transporter permease subunit [Streptosporangiales bacterium]MBO0891404.1 ABC transporter permease subunit [Acidothermales bacterium]
MLTPGSRRRLLPRGPLALQALGLVVGLALWELIGALHLISWFPSLHAVLGRVGELAAQGKLQEPLVQSVTNLVVGYLVSVVAGIVIGTLMAVSKYVNFALRVYVDALMAAPSIMLVPVLYVLFGLSSFTLIAVIVLYASVFIMVNTRNAVAGASSALHDMARSFGAGPVAAFFWVTVRSAGPEILSGLRLGMGRAVKGMFNGELFIAVFGLAALDKSYEGAFDTTGILAVAVVVIVLAVVLSTIVEFANRRLNGWALSPS